MQEMETFYPKICDLWQSLCSTYKTILELTWDEYSALLASDIEKIEFYLEQKKVFLDKALLLDYVRQEIIQQYNQTYSPIIENVRDLVQKIQSFEKEQNKRPVFTQLNLLLIDIIEKTQQQNKKNQIFLQKSITLIKDIRRDAMGISPLSIYNAKGKAINKVNSITPN